MVERGVGSWQTSKARTAVQAIMKILRDGEWHRYKELRGKAGLSSATLSKHLKELEKGVVEKKILLKSGEYPYPVVYRIREQYQAVFKIFNIPDARKLGKKRGTSGRKSEEEARARLQSMGQALGKMTNEVLRIYAIDGNFQALQQSIDSSLAVFYEVAEAVRQQVALFEEVGRKVRASLVR
jgi:DNA-binding HxlR family transcriptional regulator